MEYLHEDAFKVFAAHVAVNVVKARYDAGLTQRQVAERSGLTELTVQRAEGMREKGRTANLTLHTLYEIAKGLNTTVSELVKE